MLAIFLAHFQRPMTTRPDTQGTAWTGPTVNVPNSTSSAEWAPSQPMEKRHDLRLPSNRRGFATPAAGTETDNRRLSTKTVGDTLSLSLLTTQEPAI